MIIPYNGKIKNVPNHQPIFLTLQGTLVRLPLAGFLSLEESLGPPEPGWARMATISMQKTSENHRLSLTQPDYAASAGGFSMFDVSDLAWPGREALPESPWSVGMCWI